MFNLNDLEIKTSEICKCSILEWSDYVIEATKKYTVEHNGNLPPVLAFLRFEDGKLFHCTMLLDELVKSISFMEIFSNIIPSILFNMNAHACVCAMIANTTDHDSTLIILTDNNEYSNDQYWKLINTNDGNINLTPIENDSPKIPSKKFPGFGIVKNNKKGNVYQN